jgi:ABC-2 type transport system ATP-binding protein
LNNVSRQFGAVTALDDVSLKLAPGRIGLLGPNGAGKSTLLKLLMGMLPPSSGSGTMLGLPLGAWQLRQKVGFMPEADALVPGLQGVEYVSLAGELYGMPRDQARRRAHEVLTALELEEARYRKLEEYSTGMKQRLKLAQALVHDPELLILDEPLSGMDPIARRKSIRMIKDWGRAGKSIIVSSHILHEIESMTANILLINQGRILAEGNVHQIRDLIDEHPHTVYIKADQTRALAREFLAQDDVLSLKFEDEAVVVQTARPDAFYARLTELAASGQIGAIHEVTSPDDNLQAVFQYLVKA